jgi:hypothetical protein
MSIAVKRLASRIDIFTDEDVCFAVAELTTIKDKRFDHVPDLLFRKHKKARHRRDGLDE